MKTVPVGIKHLGAHGPLFGTVVEIDGGTIDDFEVSLPAEVKVMIVAAPGYEVEAIPVEHGVVYRSRRALSGGSL